MNLKYKQYFPESVGVNHERYFVTADDRFIGAKVSFPNPISFALIHARHLLNVEIWFMRTPDVCEQAR